MPGASRSWLQSRLELADGPLLLGELLDTPLLPGARLVVMSACQSAIADLGDLPDEAIGLPGAMLEAGAAAAVVTLWPVDDTATALLMVRFYELLLGEPCTDAAGTDDALTGHEPPRAAAPLHAAAALRQAQQPGGGEDVPSLVDLGWRS